MATELGLDDCAPARGPVTKLTSALSQRARSHAPADGTVPPHVHISPVLPPPGRGHDRRARRPRFGRARNDNDSTASAAPSKGNAQFTNKVTATAWAAGRAAKGRDVTAAEAVAAYWTPARMRAAQPVEESPRFRKALASPAEGRCDGLRGPDRTANHHPPGQALRVPPVAGKLRLKARLAATNPNLNYWCRRPTPPARCSSPSSGGPRALGRDRQHRGGRHRLDGRTLPPQRRWRRVVRRTVSSWPAYDDDLANPRPYGTWWGEDPLLAERLDQQQSTRVDDLGVMIMHPSSAGGRTSSTTSADTGFPGEPAQVHLGRRRSDIRRTAPFDGGEPVPLLR